MYNTQVRIIQDCRLDVEKVDGQIGIYEGHFEYDDVASTEPADLEVSFFKFTSPRIKLADGSYIWGCECWWEAVQDDMLPLEEAKKRLEIQKESVLELIAMSEDDNESLH